MLRTLSIWLFTSLFALSAAPAIAGPKAEKKAHKRAVKKAHKKKVAKKKVAKKKRRHRKKIKLRRAMRRTNAAIRHARSAVTKGNTGKAKLRVAVHHQRAARKARKAGRKVVALRLTRGARAAAFAAIKANKGAQHPKDLEVDADEEVAGDPDQAAADGFLEEAKEGLPAEDALAGDETLGADDADEAEEPPAKPVETPTK
jgi:hypothetical protein